LWQKYLSFFLQIYTRKVIRTGANTGKNTAMFGGKKGEGDQESCAAGMQERAAGFASGVHKCKIL
jgi:hypothetical protein